MAKYRVTLLKILQNMVSEQNWFTTLKVIELDTWYNHAYISRLEHRAALLIALSLIFLRIIISKMTMIGQSFM